ncbi:MAG: NAD(P)H-dependent glycerol-3-phosphate dehydrogenase [Candidatus Margulisiibacteriota bacterium]
MAKVVIIGAGAWGTTLAQLLIENQHQVLIWSFEEAVTNQINQLHENKKYLPGIQLSGQITASSDWGEVIPAINESRAVFFVVPSEHLRETAAKLKNRINSNILVVSATKGIEKNTFKRMSEVLIEELRYPAEKICALSGPNLSAEIAKGMPATTVIASPSPQCAGAAQELLMQARFRVYTNQDIVGVELCGALKNIIAIAAGAAEGLGLGDNAKSALLVRGIAEMARLGKRLGAHEETFYGLAGFGDLITTCQSKLSRNHHVGEEIAKGKKLDSILKSMVEIAEGVPTTLAVKSLSIKLGVDMPITDEVYNVLFADKEPYAAIQDLMTREPKREA